ncbi:MAG: sugar kinase [Pseudonocardia sp.]|nr:sugar kinase [Pseudonocardia sp.]
MSVIVVGDLGVDVLVAPAAPPAPGADVPARIRRTPGGAGANTAAWLARLGAAPTLVARVGDDEAGRGAVAGLAAAGVGTAVAVDPDLPTCTVLVLLDPPASGGGHGERTMYSDRGAAGRLAPADLDPALLAGAAHLHLSGYVLADPSSREAGLFALTAAREAGLTTSLDPQPAEDPALLRGILDRVDLLLPNLDELAALTGSRDPGSAWALVQDGAGAVAVTLGAAGAVWVDFHGPQYVTAEPVDVVDPTGAGDAFDAGVIAARLRGADGRSAAAAGCRTAARAVARAGGGPGP